MSQPPGHYPAEGDPPDTVRYWDGEQWIGDPIPAPPSSVAVPAAGGLADGEPVSKMDRFLCFLLEAVLTIVTLGIGWLIWALILVLRNEGQTPAKKIMNQKVMIEETGMPAGAARMIFMRGLVGGIILRIAFELFVIPGLILLLLVFFDNKNRTFWERASGTIVIRA
ncbi:MAG: hypothetical protein CL433_09005 [Acidimicrobiaceae bacterium]|jgi:uncharacterized RDD family membrane protein YckC|nr:hypothetical protein [Acidimicrobiaceae bacterium]